MSSSVTFQSCHNESSSINSNNVRNNEFGNFQETYNWVECESINFPGKTYFFNLRTLSSTWIRPVSSRVQLQHFSKKSKIYNNKLTSDFYDPLIIVSSDDERKDDPNNNKKAIKRKQSNKTNQKNSENFAHLQYGIGMNFYNNDDEYSNDNFSCFSKKGLPSKSNETVEDFLSENNLKRKKIYENLDSPSSYLTSLSHFLENELHVPENELIITENSKQSMNKEDVPIRSELHLKAITPDCLLRKKALERRIKQNIKKQAPLKRTKVEATKIICEMYGTRVVNYDPIERELPPGVKSSKLSDTSTTSSLRQTEDLKSAISINCEIPKVNSHVELSSESTSSTSCSCSYCSTSSNTSSTSSNFIDRSKKK